MLSEHYLILSKTPLCRDSHPHFADEEIVAQRVSLPKVTLPIHVKLRFQLKSSNSQVYVVIHLLLLSLLSIPWLSREFPWQQLGCGVVVEGDLF